MPDPERCPRCQQQTRAGASFCTACGAPLPNRAARRTRTPDPLVDQGRSDAREARPAHTPGIPGTIPVVERPPASQLAGPEFTGTARRSTLHSDAGPGRTGGSTRVEAAPGGGTGMAVNLQLVPAATGKRLGAAVIDWLPGVAVLVVTFAIGFAGITRTRSGGFIVYDTSSLVLFGGIGLGLTLAYLFVVLGLESRTGKTPGNLAMGIRSADQDGYAPGAGPVFLRGLITGAGILLALPAAVLIVVLNGLTPHCSSLARCSWWVAPGLCWLWCPTAGTRTAGCGAWNDTAAKTLVFDVKEGRDPITTGGIQGPYSFAPLDLPPVQQVLSPVAGANAPHAAGAGSAQPPAPGPQAPAPFNPLQGAAVPQANGPQAPAPQFSAPQMPASQAPAPQGPAPYNPAPQAPAPSAPMPSQTMPYTSPASFAPPATNSPGAPSGHRMPPPHADDDVERTQVRPGTAGPAPVAVLRIRLDDGRDFQLDRNVLVGRNPVGQAGEQHAQLLAVDDPGRSISKTHLHLLTDGAGIWVTDRQSTNGSAVTTPDGLRTPLVPGVPTFVTPGSSVHFGDRTFYLGQA
ncbi:RDD family protein [Pseudarthrobacter sp. Fe7]|nr:RDD family protein [Pseudarthrobacter sp. Fe7]